MVAVEHNTPQPVRYRAITIDHTKVSSDQFDFPVLISITDPTLAWYQFGGHATTSNGQDFAVYSDEARTTLLDFEVESYTQSTGAVTIWVRTSLSSTVDTTIYLQYGGDGLTNLSHSTGVWDSNFIFVHHCADNGYNDSTSFNNGVYNGPGLGNIDSGKIGGSVSASGTQYLNYGFNSGAPSGDVPVTVECWYKLASTAPVRNIPFGFSGTGNRDAIVLITGDGVGADFDNDYILPSSPPANDLNWHHLAVVYSGPNESDVKIYLDSVSLTGTVHYTPGGTLNFIGSGDLAIGTSPTAPGTGNFHGSIDECRISTVARSADWIATEYANQNSPSTFISVGVENTVGPITVNLPGIPSAKAVGPVTITKAVTRSLSGIPSSASLGPLTIIVGGAPHSFSLDGIPSSASVGSLNWQPNISFGLAGIPSSAVVGGITTEFSDITVGLPGITTRQSGSVGRLAVSVTVPLEGIPSVADAGSVTITTNKTCELPGIPPSGAMGSPILDLTIPLPGISSSVEVGSIITQTGMAISLALPAIRSSAQIGALTWQPNISFELDGIDSGVTVGDAEVGPTSHVLVLPGIPSVAKLGLFKLSQPQLVPTLIWSAPLPIEPGTPLGTNQLSARCNDTAGTFTYNPPMGSILPAGLNSLSVAFTPNFPQNWTTAFAQVTIQVGVTPAAPVKVFATNLKTRRLDSNGDYVLGTGQDFHLNSPAAVLQACRTTLLLFAGEWQYDTSAGVPWSQSILGKGTGSYDSILRSAILAVPGVASLVSYSSSVDPVKRVLTVNSTIDTIYGGQVSLSIPVGPAGALAATLSAPPPAPEATVPSMKVRKQDANGDYVLNGSRQSFWVNSPAGVAQVVLTRLKLWQSEWQYDTSAGMPWERSILGKNPSKQADAILKSYILDSPGVVGINSYSSSYDPAKRSWSVTASISTLYGPTTIQASL